MDAVTPPLSASETERLRAAPLTYAEVGATSGELPLGYHHLVVRRPVGVGAECFNAAAARVLGWRVHRGAGLGVWASDEPLVEGTVAVLRIGWGPIGLDAPVRVVRVVDEPGRRGFAYGTLPGHPESGEEEFVVEIEETGDVSVSIRAFSRPATVLMRAAGPLGRVAQRLATERYARAVRRGGA